MQEKINPKGGVCLKGPTPKQLGYRMPPEWAPHRATILTWPQSPDLWHGVPMEDVEGVWAQMAKALTPHERVKIVADKSLHDRVWAALDKESVDRSQIDLYDIPSNDCWARDHGPIFLKGPEGEDAFVDFEFNAWGGKYHPHDDDNAVPGRLAPHLNAHRFGPDFVLEGGAIDVNGAGSVLTTETCLLNPNRNGPVDRETVESMLRAYLGVDQVLWLPGLDFEGDDTDGHIDNLARFVGERTILTVYPTDPSDKAHYGPLMRNVEQLETLRDPEGRPFEILHLPHPAEVAHYRPDGSPMRLPASYANFYIANGVVLAPVFGVATDGKATDLLQRVFPDREVVPIGVIPLLTGQGAIHCVTQQQPA